jgi:hypothetical protein
MNRDVFLAILALGAYNHGYSVGMTGIDGNAIGNASVINSLPEQDVGFYAIEYNWNQETIISYRGTDDGSLDVAGPRTGPAASRSGCSTSSPPTAGKRPRCSPASGRWPATGR